MNFSKFTSRGLLRANTSIVSQKIIYPRSFSTTHPFQSFMRNRMYDNIRYPKEFDDYLLLSSSSRSPFITLWTASWCPSCKDVAPKIRDIIQQEGVGQENGGVNFAEVEFDSPTVGPLARRYAITGIPTLLAFTRGEPQLESRLTDVNEMKDLEMLRLWVTQEALKGLGGPGKGFFQTMFKVPEKPF